ncbi:hypothetical protein E2K80_16995 [Rhodophyticola sp. CCM32]|uniref:MotE family protein n=1 Tax=Rhodophyticola sp. CCM32 TaxID=2916397 RepID=UPI00107F8B97|nr:hypothetical protein [Rhodophyticola sp. CCM32]QBY02226.1 hypothetical protein E2K80_16995 [Rhodophyticola sp. CCM32]
MSRTCPPRTPRWRQRGILLLLFAGFALSGILRLGTMNMARASGHETHDMAPDEAGLICPTTEPLRDALTLVQGRAEILDTREAALDGREQALAAAQSVVEDRMAGLAALEDRLEALIALSDSAAETDLGRLTQVYETMSPDTAAPLFEQMEPSFAAGFLARMRPDAGAALLAEMPPETAYAISVLVATRNAAAPRLPEMVETEN